MKKEGSCELEHMMRGCILSGSGRAGGKRVWWGELDNLSRGSDVTVTLQE